ncbi:RNA polymerase sigma-70 factor [Pseudonocardia acaciae]|uniref:RNA polymerase sigma-70 factor n=1 Tax=Pseudonocardia acaciae TaxID=551276 RepID=UPI0004920F20|nr:RNA polymerase sigma-70 factor [Pseudonocardia acaciae]
MVADPFQAARPRLFGLAYRLLGEAAEAEDAVQDAYLRWAGRDDEVRVPEAWLVKAVTNLCLNRLTSARARRERYVGPWLPEPVLTESGALGPLETVEQRESVSLGLLVLLERLTPPERAVFVLRTAFEYTHGQIAEILDIEDAHSRQLFRRARQHLDEHRARFEVDDGRQRELVRRFLTAALDGDLAGLERMLAEDVVAWADGGGVVGAARNPVTGRAKVARYLAGLAGHPRAAGIDVTVAEVNAAPALVIHNDGQLLDIIAPQLVDGQVTAVRSMVHPGKLAYAVAQLA